MSARPYITCRELIDFIADYLEGLLTEIQANDFTRHLDICPSCRAYLATYQMTIRAGKETLRYDDSPDEDAPEDLIQAILKIRER
ncbi:MAG TPA: zf-HC2 domain-containing protein [Thermoanaerobaculia bacterium]|jgi:anti-sigma factor RsiW|nr:zf-HC2 domain-containing protein [Thermoanaerobaculia bacterium]